MNIDKVMRVTINSPEPILRSPSLKIKEYRLVRSDSTDKFSEEINSLIAQGWEIKGHSRIVDNNNYYQQMILFEDAPISKSQLKKKRRQQNPV